MSPVCFAENARTRNSSLVQELVLYRNKTRENLHFDL